VKVVLLAFKPTPLLLSATLPLKFAGTAAVWNALPFAGVVTDAAVGAVLSNVKVTAVPVKVLPALSVAVACTVYVASTCDAQVGRVALFLHVTTVFPVVALLVAARANAPVCQVMPVQYRLSELR